MGKKKNNRSGSRFFRWIRSDLPDVENTKSPVLLLGVTKISDSPSLSRRRPSEVSQHSTSGSGRFFRPPKSKYTRCLRDDARLEKIRQDLQTHKNDRQESYIPEAHSNYQTNSKDVGKRKIPNCLTLTCVGTCEDCERDRSIRSSNRGSFLFHRPENRQSSLCPSETFERCPQSTSHQDFTDIEHRFTEHISNSRVVDQHDAVSPRRSNAQFYSVTPKSTERRSLLLSNLNERFRKTLSLDSRNVDTNRAPLSLPQSRPKSLFYDSAAPTSYKSDDTFLEPQQAIHPKKKRFRPKSFFSLETFLDSKRSDSSSVDDYSSSKYKRFELESDESPVFRDRLDFSCRRRTQDKENTPDLLDLPFIIGSVRKDQSTTRRHLERVESHYYRNIRHTVVDAVPRDATEPIVAQCTSSAQDDDDDVEYIEPIRSTFTSQSTLIIDTKPNLDVVASITPNLNSTLSIQTDETDIRLPSSNTISPESHNECAIEDIDCIGNYEIEVKEADLLIDRTKELIVKIMDKSVDSIGSCSLDVDASTDFSDTTSGSLNLLTPSSTTSRIRDFTSRIHERAASGVPSARRQPSPNIPNFGDNHRPRPKVVVDAASHRSRSHKKIEHKKPSYLNLACSVNGYSNLTTYDSKLRQNINKSREASPIRPITHTYYRGEVNQSLVVPVPVSADKLLVPTFQPHDAKFIPNLTESAPSEAHTDPYLATSPILVYMAEENRQLKSDFLGKMAATTSTTTYDGQKYSGMPYSNTNDQVDNVTVSKEIFKSSYSETNIKKSSGTTTQGKTERYTAESCTVHSSRGVMKQVEITKENGEKLTSPMKSFIQQRVERLYGPGALAQGFFNQKRHKKVQNESEDTSDDNKVLTEKSINCLAGEHHYSSVRTSRCHENSENVEYTSPNGSPGLPVLRHLRPEFRAQLPILSPKKSPGRSDITAPSLKSDMSQLNFDCEKKSPAPKVVNCKNSNEKVNSVINSVAGNVDKVKLSEQIVNKDSKINARGTKLNGTGSKVNGTGSKVNGTGSKVNGTEAVVNGLVSGGEAKLNGTASEVRDAYYFLDVEKQETERLIQLAVSAEAELETLQKEGVSEEVLGLLRSAAGKARLLATQKMQQFEGLCYNHINACAGEQFPTTLQDLQGFWDMVCLQVRHVEQLFAHIAALRDNGWQEIEVQHAASPATPSPRSAVRPPRTCVPANNAKARLAAERREADRKAMLEQRRRMAREKQAAARSCAPGSSREDQNTMAVEGSQEVEIFIGGSKAKSVPQGDHINAAHSHESAGSR